MGVKRILGARFASVHGPADERKLATWTLDLGFEGLLVGPSPRPVDWKALRAESADLPFDLPVARLPALAGAGIASAARGDRETAAVECSAQVSAIRAIGISTVVLDVGRVPVGGGLAAAGAEPADDRAQPGERDDLRGPAIDDWTRDAAQALFARRGPNRDAALDRVCRALFSLTRTFPDMTFALRPSGSITGIADVEGLTAIFEDLGGSRLLYWHEAAITAKRKQWLDADQGAWLEAFAARIGGFALEDAAESGPGAVGAPPGSGLVDYAMLASYVPRNVPLPGVVDLDPGVDPAEVAGVRSFLAKFGL